MSLNMLRILSLIIAATKNNARRKALSHDYGIPAIVQSLERRFMLTTIKLTNRSLTITSPEAKVEVGRSSDGHVTVNGELTSFLARNVRTINITAMNSDGANVDLSRVTRTTFPYLRSTVINTGRGNDTVTGSFASDKITTGDGDDTIIDSLGWDNCNGGAGSDRYQIKDSGRITVGDCWLIIGHSFRLHRISGIDTVAVNASSSSSALIFDSRCFSGVAEVFGSMRNDRITTGKGNDFVSSGGGSDMISTGNGDDIILIDKGGINIRINAGAGNDFVDASTSTAATSVIIQDAAGDDTYFLSTGNDTVTGFAGNVGNDFISGGNGNDNINYSMARSGTIFADGGDGNDTIKGGRGDDIILGGAGRNVLIGGLGFDIIDGIFDDPAFITSI